MSRRLPSRKELREDLKAASIEIIGTTVFLLLALGAVQSANLSVAATQGLQIAENGPHSLERNVYISTAAGVSLLASAWMFYRITGGLFNPAVSLALLLIGQITPIRFVLYVIAQLAGAIMASALLLGLTPGPLLIKNKLGDGTSLVQGVFIEMFCTAILLLAVLMLAAEKSALTPFAPIGISMTLFAVHMFAITFTGSSLNPARSFGPSCLVGFDHDHWIYWVGPLAGSCLSVAFYAWLKHTKYWDINPKQMDTSWRDSPEDPIAAAERREREKYALKEGSSLRRPKYVSPNDEYDHNGVTTRAGENV